MDGLVLGTELCPNATTISSETGLLARNHGRVHLRIRCAPCQARKDFNKILLTYDLRAEPDQTACENKKCFKALWEGSRYCKHHMKEWVPEMPIRREASMKKVRDLFLKAASKQWSPMGLPMTRILEKVELDENATSDLLFVDTEFSTRRHRLYQLSICDSKERKKLDCFPIYNEGQTSQARSSLDLKGVSYRVKGWEKKMSTGQGFAIDRGFNAKMVTEKLEELVSDETIFIAWAGWALDVEYARDWLEEEEVSHHLPANEKVCLLYPEFKENVKKWIGDKCFKGHSFPLTLPFLFSLLFQGHDLVGWNHDALVDAQQTSILHRLFLDLCKPPEKRVLFKGTLPIMLPGMQPPITNLFRRKAEEELVTKRLGLSEWDLLAREDV
ncbi:hypothetical protein N7488_005401 [Penicillium malachiteum]|nr:hypothetical protein N7488_005401 [Penicillium malachiteum]